MPPSLVWLRRDLRLADQPALSEALALGGPVIPVFLWAPAEEGRWAPGAASRWWLHHALAALDADLRGVGSRLVLRQATSSLDALRALLRETGARTLFWTRQYEPAALARDARVREALTAEGCAVRECGGALLHEPWDVATGAGKPYQVFTPFWRATQAARPAAPGPANSRSPTAAGPRASVGARSVRVTPAVPRRLPAPTTWPASEPLAALGLLPSRDWAARFAEHGEPGEAGAQQALLRFTETALDDYTVQRDHPGTDGTSRLSAHLHFGSLSPRQIWQALPPESAGTESFRRELGWREFAHHLLVHFPRTTDEPLREPFARFPWREDAAALAAWQRGATGYPIVDAGMRQLWATGWMHNRVRMIVASFLVKHLLIRWQEGAAWFWDTLVDADLANNTLNWQWSAGCGADAAPYFRIFHPVLQGRRFDADGAYLRRWVPELARLPARWMHAPWEAPASVLQEAGLRLGRDYPAPIVDHAAARARALAAFATLRQLAPGSANGPQRGAK
ncbi:MAG: cryptochrome/photolyase family protein [Planctomycetota bacterium]